MKSAASLYEALRYRRDRFVRRAEDAAALTLPALFPDERSRHYIERDFDYPQQGVGARGVNHLSSRLLLALLPPGSPFFRFTLSKEAQQVLGEDPEAFAEVEKSFRDIEDAVRMEIETSGLRVTAAELFKHLVVTGNACTFVSDKGMSLFPLNQYVCERDAEGDDLVLLIIKELTTKMALPQDLRELVELRGADTKFPETSHESQKVSEDVALFTKVWLEDGKYYVHQELSDGTVIPETAGTYEKDLLPYRPLRWTKVVGEQYGRGLVEEMLGDLKSLEALARSMVDGALAASRLVGLIRPNGATHAQDINKAANGEFILGSAEDVTFLQTQKHADFRTVGEISARIERRVEASFLLNSSVIRDAERVTAEEVRWAAQELESTLGGVFSVLAQEFQLPLVKVLLDRLERRGEIPEFTNNVKKNVKPIIITGVDALGRIADLERLRSAFGVLQTIIGPEAVAQAADVGPLIRYVFTQAGVRSDGFVKSPEQIQEEQAQAQQQAMMMQAIQSGGGPLVNQMGAAMREGAAQPQEPEE